MKKLLTLSFSALFSFSAFSMPCDTGYSCKSESGKYQIELQRCRYINSLNLNSITIDGNEVAYAELNAGWDGDSVLAFEISLPSVNQEDLRVLSVETNKTELGTRGVAIEKVTFYNPGPSTVVNYEAMTCVVTE